MQIVIFGEQSVRTSGKIRQIDALISKRQLNVKERDEMMTSNSYRESAKIYQFPAGGRAAMRSGRPLVKPIDELAVDATRAVVGGSWYHEEAIRETDPAGKR
jgi:hypothetical protein